jgi:putative membrane protein
MLFWIHMIQHVLLCMVVPPLLILGRPLGLLRTAGPAQPRRAAEPALRSRTVSALTFPAAGLAVYAAVITGTHLT